MKKNLIKNTLITLTVLGSVTAFSATAHAADYEFRTGEDGKLYWYENGVRQGTYEDTLGILGDGTNRGREIYDPVSNAWYWLDSCYDGAVARDKEVWFPYTYQDELTQAEDGYGRKANDYAKTRKLSNYQTLINQSNFSSTLLGDMVERQMMEQSGKWVRYDADGHMMKGWVTIEGDLALIYPDQAGNTYYYDTITGSMVKNGYFIIDGYWNTFNENGVLIASANPKYDTGVEQVSPAQDYTIVPAYEEAEVAETIEETPAAEEQEVETPVEEVPAEEPAEETPAAVEPADDGNPYNEYRDWEIGHTEVIDSEEHTYPSDGSKYYITGTITKIKNEDGSVTVTYGDDCGMYSNRSETITEQSYTCNHENMVSDGWSSYKVEYYCPDCGYRWIPNTEEYERYHDEIENTHIVIYYMYNHDDLDTVEDTIEGTNVDLGKYMETIDLTYLQPDNTEAEIYGPYNYEDNPNKHYFEVNYYIPYNANNSNEAL